MLCASNTGPSTQVRRYSHSPDSSRTFVTQLKQMPMPHAIGVSSDSKQGTFALGG